MNNQYKRPLYDKVAAFAGSSPLSFHVPGHKNGVVFPTFSKEPFSSLLPFDLTELEGLDDLHEPEGVIGEAQDLAADLYGTLSTFFLVGGSTAGNLAMIMSAFQEGDKVAVQRDAHKSVINGLRLAKVEPVFISPIYDNKTGLSLGVTIERIKEAFQLYKGIKGIVLTSPTYYGWAAPLHNIIEYVHEQEGVVLVDEAHGAHFVYGEPFPIQALDQGADMVVQSAHKTLPAMTMGAFLHVKSSRLLKKAKEYTGMLQSSSPSYPIMMSLDIARSYLALLTKEDKQKIKNSLLSFRQELQQIEELDIVFPPPGIKDDLLKCTLKAPFSQTGWVFQSFLQKEGVYPELADHRHVLLVLPLSSDFPWDIAAEKIRKAVKKMAVYKEIQSSRRVWSFPFPPITRLSFPIKELENKGIISCPLEEAEGEIAAEDMIPYPPGVPLLLKGEKIDRPRLDALSAWLKEGGRIQGGTKETDKCMTLRIYKG
ncbi:aminotransferase class I/II-fold pyridoxal phosphate-dependent enzyme [Thalassorhabdus alkalitolerans]|uniref:Aminotransferase class I/II-fold pyridoxal phosphate-dependent enzyme n=1 Tax=Thalassorhabdus alkalitolerans TaxID=2282697 RepID=A0ABW0YSR5_9BACI